MSYAATAAATVAVVEVAKAPIFFVAYLIVTDRHAVMHNVANGN
jgi:hypothetical protein